MVRFLLVILGMVYGTFLTSNILCGLWYVFYYNTWFGLLYMSYLEYLVWFMVGFILVILGVVYGMFLTCNTWCGLWCVLTWCG